MGNGNDSRSLSHLRQAARLAWRGFGAVEPNPMVGCVIVDRAGHVVGAGHHRHLGGPHAEIDALSHAGDAARGATVYVTLEPCAHHGRTGPCADALIEAGVARVVFAQRDPTPVSAGGAERLRKVGIAVDQVDGCAEAVAVGRPYVHRVESGRPWVIAKWAQSIDGRVATRCGMSQWISGKLSRRRVHRVRGRVDAIMTGIGTVIGDDPVLTSRAGRARRLARRVVVDAELQIPLESRLVTTAARTPTIVACTATAAQRESRHVEQLGAAGVDLLQLPTDPASGDLDLAQLLGELAGRYDVATVLVEAGPGLMGRLMKQRLVDLAWVFIAPMVMADADAVPCARGMVTSDLADAIRLEPIRMTQRGDDAEVVAAVSPGPR